MKKSHKVEVSDDLINESANRKLRKQNLERIRFEEAFDEDESDFSDFDPSFGRLINKIHKEYKG